MGCAGAPPPADPPLSDIDRELDPEPAAAEPAQKSDARALAQRIVEALAKRDLEVLAAVAHPSGLRFSPYAYLDESDVVLRPAELEGALSDPTIRHWGAYDGSGDPIELSFADYFARFVYDVDFAKAPKVAVNEMLGSGNTISNLTEIYPDATFVEFHFPRFDPDAAGMDWRSLRLVLVPHDGRLRLAAIVHDQWTI
jgi:hypothetical protein